MTLASDREYLRELARQVTGGVIVEIGSYIGRSARAMAEVALVPVYCIDLWDSTVPRDKRRIGKHTAPGTFEKFCENTKGLNVMPIRGLSVEVARAWDEPIGLLFIDGDHSYEGCMADYEGFAGYIINGGYLVIHDYHEKYEGVIRAVEEIKKLPEWRDWTRMGHSTISAIKEVNHVKGR